MYQLEKCCIIDWTISHNRKNRGFSDVQEKPINRAKTPLFFFTCKSESPINILLKTLISRSRATKENSTKVNNDFQVTKNIITITCLEMNSEIIFSSLASYRNKNSKKKKWKDEKSDSGFNDSDSKTHPKKKKKKKWKTRKHYSEIQIRRRKTIGSEMKRIEKKTHSWWTCRVLWTPSPENFQKIKRSWDLEPYRLREEEGDWRKSIEELQWRRRESPSEEVLKEFGQEREQ